MGYPVQFGHERYGWITLDSDVLQGALDNVRDYYAATRGDPEVTTLDVLIKLRDELNAILPPAGDAATNYVKLVAVLSSDFLDDRERKWLVHAAWTEGVIPDQYKRGPKPSAGTDFPA